MIRLTSNDLEGLREFFDGLNYTFRQCREHSLSALGDMNDCHQSNHHKVKSSLRDLLVGLIGLQIEYRRQRRSDAADYNIFYLIGRSRAKPRGLFDREVLLHSPFLAELLDPEGVHGQGAFFYERFLDLLDSIEKERIAEKLKLFRAALPGESQYHSYKVTRETDNIDILIRSYKLRNNFALIIENKVYAVDS
jgi:hypothetical protein